MLFCMRCFLCLGLWILSGIALGQAPSVFYPLPVYDQGQILAAQNLYNAEGGGLWIHDIQGRLRLYDGTHILPREDAVLIRPLHGVTYAAGAFWTFNGNQIFRTDPGRQKQSVVAVNPGVDIQRIGHSGHFLWFADSSNFYSFHLKTGELESDSLSSLNQFSASSRFIVNDAQWTGHRWILATNSGVYLSEGGEFSHLNRSGTQDTGPVFYVQRRKELIIGTNEGARIVQIPDGRLIRTVGSGKVLSVTTARDEYWIGTTEGLFVYSPETGSVEVPYRHSNGFYTLKGQAINSLLNDHSGGMWIGTEKGIYYYSLYGQIYNRYYQEQFLSQEDGGLRAVRALSGPDLLLLTDRNLFVYSTESGNRRRLNISAHINDLLIDGQAIWLGTDHGLLKYSLSGLRTLKNEIPDALSTLPVSHLARDSQGIIWGVSNNQIWSYDPDSGVVVRQWGEINTALPGITLIRASDKLGLLIGTEQGIYVLNNGRITMIRASRSYGRIMDIREGKASVWAAGRYGLFRIDLTMPSYVSAVSLPQSDVTPKCLMVSEHGIWLVSSTGLSLYRENGDRMKHFSAPNGLINNEFRAGLCDVKAGEEGASMLVLGSSLGLITVSERALMAQSVRGAQIIISRILDNQTSTIALGGLPAADVVLPYGHSLTFRFGMLPEGRNPELEYRFSAESTWKRIDGTQLTFGRLLPGDYSLFIRGRAAGGEETELLPIPFTVSGPWYLSGYALMLFGVAGLMTGGIILWLLTGYQRRIRAEVRQSLGKETERLIEQQQSLERQRTLLKKQLEIRTRMLRGAIVLPPDEVRPSVPLSDETYNLFRSPESGGADHTGTCTEGGTPLNRLDILQLVELVAQSWQNELSERNLSLQIQSAGRYVILSTTFTLDEVINLIFADVIARAYCNQPVCMVIESDNNTVSLTVLDQGRAETEILQADSEHPTELHNSFLQAMSESGGQVWINRSEERNLLTLTWPAAPVDAHDEESDTDECDSGDEWQSWLAAVRGLIAEHYSDPLFGTSLAAGHLCMSERSLQRRFKYLTNRTFMEYLIDVRLDNAGQILSRESKVAQVAYECGFNDPSYFSQRFKQRYGCTPTQFVDERSARESGRKE